MDSPSTAYGPAQANQARVGRAIWSNLAPIEYSYLLAFWRTGVREGSLAFLIDLPFPDDQPREHVACFQGGLRVSSVSGGSASVDGTIAFVPRVPGYALSDQRALLISRVAEAI